MAKRGKPADEIERVLQIETVPEAATTPNPTGKNQHSKGEEVAYHDDTKPNISIPTERRLRAITRAPDVVDSVANWQHGKLPPPAAEIRQGTKRDAILHSVGANAAHGLRRSNDDKERAVKMVLRDEEWFTESDRWIAEQCAVNKDTVTKWRASLEATAHIGQSPEREGKDGKVRRLPVKAAPKVEADPLPEEVPMPDEELEVRGNVAPC